MTDKDLKIQMSESSSRLIERKKGLKNLIVTFTESYVKILSDIRVAVNNFHPQGPDWELCFDVVIPSRYPLAMLHWYCLTRARKQSDIWLTDVVQQCIKKQFNHEELLSHDELLFYLVDFHYQKNITSFPSYRRLITCEPKLRDISKFEMNKRKRSVIKRVRRKGYNDKHPRDRKSRGHSESEKLFRVLADLSFIERMKESDELSESLETFVRDQERLAFENL